MRRMKNIGALIVVASGALVTMSPLTAKTARPPALTIVAEPQQAPAKEGFIEVGGARLWYWDTGGKGEAVILLHPATGSGEGWAYQQPVFAKAGLRVIGYSRRGFYKSETTDPAASASDTEDLHKLLQQLGLSKVHLVGSAAGSFTVSDFVVRYPEMLHSAVIASSMIGLQDADFRERQARLVTPEFNRLPEESRELGPSYRAMNPQGTARWVEIQKRARNPRPTEQGGAPTGPPRGGLRGGVTYEALAAATRKVPTLLLTADGDQFMPPALLEHVAAKLQSPNVSVAIVDNAGHAAFWEQPAEFNRIVLDFIKRH